MRRFLWILLPLMISSSGSDSPGQEPVPREAAFRPLPGKAIGVVVLGGQRLLQAEGRSGPPDGFCFSRDGQSYQWMYVVSKNEPSIGDLELPIGSKGEKTQRFRDLSLADSRSAKHWGLGAPFALVEVEVNGGEGSPAADSFVATQVRKLDGTPEFPLVVANVLRELQASYKGYVRSQQDAVEKALHAAQQKYLKDQKPTGPREEIETLYVTWLSESERLQVRFSTRVSDGVFRAGQGVERATDAGAAAERQRDDSPRAAATRYGTLFGVDFGMTYEVAKSGKLERSRPTAIQSFKTELPPPGGPPPAPRQLPR